MYDAVQYSFQRSALNAYHALRSKYRRMYVLGVYSRAMYQLKCEKLFTALGNREDAINRECAPKPTRIKYDVDVKGIPPGTYTMNVVDTDTRRTPYGDVVTFKLKLL